MAANDHTRIMKIELFWLQEFIVFFILKKKKKNHRTRSTILICGFHETQGREECTFSYRRNHSINIKSETQAKRVITHTKFPFKSLKIDIYALFSHYILI